MSVDRDAIIASLDEAEGPLLSDEMRSSVLDHGARTPRVVVLLHGLTSSPRTWREFARVRFGRGENVLVPRLPRHGHANRATTTLLELTADELRTQAERIMTAAQALGDEIVVVGHSLGGALALHLAHRDERVHRAIALAPFLGLKRLPPEWHAFAHAVLERAPVRFLYWNVLDREGKKLPQHGYPRYTTRSLAAGLTLADALRRDARSGPPRARHIEIVRNASETAVSSRAIDDLVRAWRAAAGANVRVHRLIGLGPSHDLVEPERPNAPAARFLPQLHALLDDAPPDEDRVIDVRG
ncbi:MAG: alpha/beta hydrolase [Candidatus Eremiobacteraeota bacterium]|nr:alpha/beta hydrolase [Candidatus Eremiobacteraeota bacterium]